MGSVNIRRPGSVARCPRSRASRWRSRAAVDAGANGIILSRKYSEMRLDNLRAAGRAVREAGKRA
jgi:hypothetical protein